MTSEDLKIWLDDLRKDDLTMEAIRDFGLFVAILGAAAGIVYLLAAGIEPEAPLPTTDCTATVGTFVPMQNVDEKPDPWAQAPLSAFTPVEGTDAPAENMEERPSRRRHGRRG